MFSGSHGNSLLIVAIITNYRWFIQYFFTQCFMSVCHSRVHQNEQTVREASKIYAVSGGVIECFLDPSLPQYVIANHIRLWEVCIHAI